MSALTWVFWPGMLSGFFGWSTYQPSHPLHCSEFLLFDLEIDTKIIYAVYSTQYGLHQCCFRWINLKFFFFSIGILAALSAMGVQTSAVLASLGVENGFYSTRIVTANYSCLKNLKKLLQTLYILYNYYPKHNIVGLIKFKKVDNL